MLNFSLNLSNLLNSLGVIHFTQFVLGTIGIILLPGPNSLFVLTLAVQNRQKANTSLWQKIKLPVSAAMGIMVGDFILVTIATLGAASILQKYPLLFSAVKYMGAAYLSYLALTMLQQAWHEYKTLKYNNLDNNINNDINIIENIENINNNKIIKTTPIQAFKTALSISLLNPKAIFFFIAFFIQFIKADYTPLWVPVLFLIIVLQIISMSYLSSLIFFGSKLVLSLQKYKYSKILGFAAVACLFLYFSMQLIYMQQTA